MFAGARRRQQPPVLPAGPDLITPHLDSIVNAGLGEFLQSPYDLRALCRVSKAFNSTFRPLFWRHLYLDDMFFDRIRRIAELPTRGCFEFTQKLEIGLRAIPLDPYREADSNSDEEDEDYEDYEDFHRPTVFDVTINPIDGLDELLIKCQNLRSFTIVGGLTLQLMQEARTNTSVTPLQCLGNMPNIESITLIGANDQAMRGLQLPSFKNLVQLELEGLHPGPTGTETVDDIIKLILASPSLNSLGLSLSQNLVESSRSQSLSELVFSQNAVETKPNRCLAQLVDGYSKEASRIQRQLRLSRLHLGRGFVPEESFYELGYDYIEKLTDLSKLRELRIQNTAATIVHDQRVSPIAWKLFLSAKNLRALRVDRLSQDIVDFINYLRKIENPQLDELDASLFFATTLTPGTPISINDATGAPRHIDASTYPSFSKDIRLTGNHWRRLALGKRIDGPGKGGIQNREALAKNIVRDYLTNCEDLEDLAFPALRTGTLQMLKPLLLSSKKLRRVELPYGNVTENEAPVETEWEALFIQNAEVEGPEAVLSEDAYSFELERKDIAKEIFARNRQRVLNEDGVAAIDRLGIGRYAYHCLEDNGRRTLEGFDTIIEVTENAPSGPVTRTFEIERLSGRETMELSGAKKVRREARQSPFFLRS